MSSTQHGAAGAVESDDQVVPADHSVTADSRPSSWIRSGPMSENQYGSLVNGARDPRIAAATCRPPARALSQWGTVIGPYRGCGYAWRDRRTPRHRRHPGSRAARPCQRAARRPAPAVASMRRPPRRSRRRPRPAAVGEAHKPPSAGNESIPSSLHAPAKATPHPRAPRASVETARWNRSRGTSARSISVTRWRATASPPSRCRSGRRRSQPPCGRAGRATAAAARGSRARSSRRHARSRDRRPHRPQTGRPHQMIEGDARGARRAPRPARRAPDGRGRAPPLARRRGRCRPRPDPGPSQGTEPARHERPLGQRRAVTWHARPDERDPRAALGQVASAGESGHAVADDGHRWRRAHDSPPRSELRPGRQTIPGRGAPGAGPAARPIDTSRRRRRSRPIRVQGEREGRPRVRAAEDAVHQRQRPDGVAEVVQRPPCAMADPARLLEPERERERDHSHSAIAPTTTPGRGSRRPATQASPGRSGRASARLCDPTATSPSDDRKRW